jgi:hypothetical protein
LGKCGGWERRRLAKKRPVESLRTRGDNNVKMDANGVGWEAAE